MTAPALPVDAKAKRLCRCGHSRGSHWSFTADGSSLEFAECHGWRQYPARPCNCCRFRRRTLRQWLKDRL
jgi:hypothetical protein